MVGGQTLTESSANELGLATLNRDPGKAQEITVDKDIGGLNATMTVDNRLFTEAGRESVGKDFSEIGENTKAVTGGVAKDTMHTTGTHSAYEVMFTEEVKCMSCLITRMEMH